MRIRMFCLTLIMILAATCLAVGAESGRQAIPPLNDELFVIRIHYSHLEQKGELASRLAILDAPPGQDYMVALADQEQMDQLLLEGYEISVDTATTRALRGPEGYECYRTPATIESQLHEYAAKYPDLTQLLDIGDSWDKLNESDDIPGHDIWMLRMTSNATSKIKPPFFIMGNIHANEMISGEAVMTFIEYLLKKYGKNPDATWILDNRVVYAVPMVNPDGRLKVEAGMYWRKNTNYTDGCYSATTYGVDLNRNFNTNWAGPGSNPNPCNYNYPGSAAESEPETKAIADAMRQIFPNRSDTKGLMITLHSYGQYVVWPWGNGYNTYQGLKPKDLPGLTALGQRFAMDNGYTAMMADDWYAAAGATEDWAYEELDIAGFTFEMGTLQPPPCPAIQEEIAKNLPAFLYAAKAAGPDPYEVVRGPEVADLTLNTWWVTGGQDETATITATADDTKNGWMPDISFPGIVPDRGRPVNAGELTIPVVTIVPANGSAEDSLNATPEYTEAINLDTSTVVTALDQKFDTAVEKLTATFPTEGLTKGRHLISLRAMDDFGHWGATSSTYLTVAPALAGWWHQPGDKGIGISVELGPNIAYIALAAYNEEGQPAWWSCVALREGDNTWSGDLYSFTGTGISRETALPKPHLAGSLNLTLTGHRTAKLTWDIDGVAGEKSLDTFLEDYTSGVYVYNPNNGWWLIDGAIGSGLFVEVQNETLYAALFHYDDRGQPQWWGLGADFGGFPLGSTEYAGDMVSVLGGETMDGLGGNNMAPVNHGNAKLTFLGDDKARLEWNDKIYNLTRFNLSRL